jgi:hypothetical protein
MVKAGASRQGLFIYRETRGADMLCGMAAASARHIRTIESVMVLTVLAGLAGLRMGGWHSDASAFSVVWAAVSAAAGIVLLLYAPGRLLADILRVRLCAGMAGRVLLAAALSLGTVPFALDLLWRTTHRGWVILLIWWAVLCVLVVLRGRRGPTEGRACDRLFEGRAVRVLAVLVGVWLTVCIVGAYWPAERAGYPIAAIPHDYVKHQAVLMVLGKWGLPLGNPFCAELAHEAYYYYHYFYLLPATVRLWTGNAVGIAAAFALFTAAVALVCVGLVYWLARRLTGSEGPAAFAALCASLIGGLDVIPLALKRQFVVTLDSWADQAFRLHNVYTNYLWCPQHVLGLAVLLLAVALLSAAPRARWWLALGPVLMATLTGATAYLALAALVALAVYALYDVLASPGRDVSRWRALGGWVVIGVLGLVLMSPQVHGYVQMSERFGDGLSTEWPANSWALIGRLLPPGPLANLLDLPWRLLLEMGVGFVACVLVGRAWYGRLWRDSGLRLLLTCAVVGVVLMAVFRSGVHRHDYGFKVGLFAGQALAAILCGGMMTRAAHARWWNPLGWRLRKDYRGWRRALAGGLLATTALLGLPVGLYEAPVSAVRRFVMNDPTWMAEREGYRYLRDELPADAVVQTITGTQRAVLVQMAEREWGVLDPHNSDVGVFRPPDMEALDAVLEDVVRAGQTASSREAYELLRGRWVSHVFVGLAEREHWALLDKFDDARYFNPVFRHGPVTIFALAAGDGATD